MASSSAPSRSWAGPSASGSVTSTVANVPSARQVRAAGSAVAGISLPRVIRWRWSAAGRGRSLAAEVGGGAGAGVDLGGASVGDGDEPDPPPDEPEVAGELAELEAAWPGWTVGLRLALGRATWRRLPVDEEWDPDGEADADSLALCAGAACAVVWAGAVRANKVAMPTAVTALSWVARQVSRDRRRSPAARASPGNSSIMVAGGAAEMTVGESRYGSPVPWV